jgi:hypothetical protein
VKGRCVTVAVLLAVCGAAPAGDPVRGARVRAGGRSGTTNGRGRVTLALRSSRALTARATRAGYTGATERLAVRR